MLNICTEMNTFLESPKLKAYKAELVVIKQDIEQMSNRISTLHNTTIRGTRQLVQLPR